MDPDPTAAQAALREEIQAWLADRPPAEPLPPMVGRVAPGGGQSPAPLQPELQVVFDGVDQLLGLG